MPVVPVSVKRSRRTQRDLQRRPEHASASPGLLAAVGCEVGQQARVRRQDGFDALYTISEPQDEQPESIVRMGPGGRERLDILDELEGFVDSMTVHPTATAADAECIGEFIEQLDDGAGTGLTAIAPHGGEIERHTDDQARRVAELLDDLGVSSWLAQGWNPGGGAFLRWHITSVDLHPASFPKLETVAGRGFTHAVAFHGLEGANRPTDVLIGGAAPRSLKLLLQTNISDAVAGSGLVVRLAGSGDPLGGASRANIVNRLTANRRNGIQIEQSFEARTGKWSEIATAVADTYRTQLG
jgi:phage replication-related protein YjqB (UPF0714/DUF867 family)